MKKISWWWLIISLFVGIAGTIISIFWHEAFPKGTVLDLSALLTFLWMIITVGTIGGVVWSTNKQIRNQNIEGKRPFI